MLQELWNFLKETLHKNKTVLIPEVVHDSVCKESCDVNCGSEVWAEQSAPYLYHRIPFLAAPHPCSVVLSELLKHVGLTVMQNTQDFWSVVKFVHCNRAWAQRLRAGGGKGDGVCQFWIDRFDHALLAYSGLNPIWHNWANNWLYTIKTKKL